MKKLVSLFLIFAQLATIMPAHAALSESDKAILTAKNTLTNPGAESSTAAFTASGGTFTTTTTAANIGSGNASFSWDSNSAGQTVLSGYQTVTSGDGYSSQSGVVSARFKCASGTCTHKLQVYDGSVVLNEATVTSSTAGFARTSVTFTYPASGTIGWRLISVASNEPIIYFDDLYRGLAEGYNVTTSPTSSSPAKAGFIQYTAATSCPTGWLSADGSAISRTTYAQFFTNVGTTYGSGDGSTTVNLPNAQGVFIRGAGSQTISSISYTGTQGTTQGDRMQGHQHPIVIPGSLGGSSHTMYGDYAVGGSTGIAYPNNRNDITTATNPAYAGDPVSDGSNGTPRTGSETRPANISLKACVKMFDDAESTLYKPDQTADLLGTTFYSGTSTCPMGSIAADGSAISRTSYAPLFARIGTTHGTGDGSTTFNVPDLRGVFVRGSGSQTISSLTYSGTLGAKQTDATKKNGLALTDPGHFHSLTSNSNSDYQRSTGFNGEDWNNTVNGFRTRNTDTKTTGITLGNGDSETRPANIALQPCIWTVAGTAPLLVGSVTSNTSGLERIERAAFSNNGTTCTVSSQSGSWVTNVSRSSTGVCAITIATGIFSSTPSCIMTTRLATANIISTSIDLQTATGFTARTALDNNSGVFGPYDTDFAVICMGPR